MVPQREVFWTQDKPDNFPDDFVVGTVVDSLEIGLGVASDGHEYPLERSGVAKKWGPKNEWDEACK